jgi:uncharacterized membrane protein
VNELFQNPHPPLSGFPVVLLTLLLLTEMTALFRPSPPNRQLQSFLLLWLLGFTVLTYFSGYWAFDQANQSFCVAEDLILRHQGYAKFTALLLVPLGLIFALLQNDAGHVAAGRVLRALWRITLVTVWLIAAYTSSLGGKLVFAHGAAVHVSSAARTGDCQKSQ